jgi:hypothetical protein
VGVITDGSSLVLNHLSLVLVSTYLSSTPFSRLFGYELYFDYHRHDSVVLYDTLNPIHLEKIVVFKMPP